MIRFSMLSDKDAGYFVPSPPVEKESDEQI